MNKNLPESVQWSAFRPGDRKAFRQLYFAHFERLLNYRRQFGLPPEQVADAITIQDSFVERWHYRATLSDTTSVQFYLLRSLRNQWPLADLRWRRSGGLRPAARAGGRRLGRRGVYRRAAVRDAALATRILAGTFGAIPTLENDRLVLRKITP